MCASVCLVALGSRQEAAAAAAAVCMLLIRVMTLWACYLSSFLSSAICVCGARAAAVVKHAGLHKPFACCVRGNDVGMRLPLQVKKWKHIKRIVHLSRYNPGSLTWFMDATRKDEEGMKAFRVFLCSTNIECWAVFHLNLGSILCGILIVLPSVWLGPPSQLTSSRADPPHLHTPLDCEMSAKCRMINDHWPLDDKPPTLEIPSQFSHQVII